MITVIGTCGSEEDGSEAKRNSISSGDLGWRVTQCPACKCVPGGRQEAVVEIKLHWQNSSCLLTPWRPRPRPCRWLVCGLVPGGEWSERGVGCVCVLKRCVELQVCWTVGMFGKKANRRSLATRQIITRGLQPGFRELSHSLASNCRALALVSITHSSSNRAHSTIFFKIQITLETVASPNTNKQAIKHCGAFFLRVYQVFLSLSTGPGGGACG